MSFYEDQIKRLLSDKSFSELLKDTCRAFPQKTALKFQEEEITFEELSRRVAVLAKQLKANGAEPGKVVALRFVRGSSLLISLLAIIETGAAYQPLSLKDPLRRIQKKLAETKPILLLTENLNVQTIDVYPFPLNQTAEQTTIGVYSLPDWEAQHYDENPFYILHTSGTTGLPKGTMLGTDSIRSRFKDLINEYQYSENEISLFHFSVSFDVHVRELLYLMLGFTVVVASEKTAHDPQLLKDLLEKEQATLFCGTKSTIKSLLKLKWENKAPMKLTWGGDKIDLQTGRELLKNGNCVYIEYGMTETGMTTHVKKVTSIATDCEALPLGRPLGSNGELIVDVVYDDDGFPIELNPAQEGDIGILAITGTMAIRYVNNPDATRKIFFTKDGVRYCLTGDSVRRNDEGDLLFLSRKLLKIGEIRVSLEEIEEAINEHKLIHDCAVVVSNAGSLAAFVVLKDPTTRPKQYELEEWLRGYLPEDHIPPIVVPLQILPTTDHEKVDKNELIRLLDNKDSSAEESDQEPSLVEKNLLSLFHEASDKFISLDEEFAGFGLESMTQTLYLLLIKDALGVEVSFAEFKESKNIKGLAQIIQERRQFDPRSRASTPRSADMFVEAQPVRLTPPQQNIQSGMNFITNPDEIYTITEALTLASTVTPERVQSALETLVERHDALRTRYFTDSDGIPWQEPATDYRFVLFEGETDDEDSLMTAIEEFAYAPFELEEGISFRAAFFKVNSTQSHILVLNTHHLSGDFWSYNIIKRDLMLLLNNELLGKSPKSHHRHAEAVYRDRALAEKRSESTWIKKEGEGYYVNYPGHALLGDKLPTDQKSSAAASIDIELDAEDVEKLEELALKAEVTPFSILLTLQYLSFYERTRHKQGDLVIGVSYFGRNDLSLESTVGMFVNMLGIRIKFSDLGSENSSFIKLIKHVDRVRVKVMDHNLADDYELRRLRALGVPDPTIQKALIYYPPEDPFIVDGQKVESLRLPIKFSAFPLALIIQKLSTGKMSCRFVHQTDPYSAQWAESFAKLFCTLFSNAIGKPERLINDIPLLSEGDTADWNPAPQKFPNDLSFNQLIEQHTLAGDELRPCSEEDLQRIAIIEGDMTLSYQDLFSRSAQLAKTLEDQGLEAESLVAIACEGCDKVIAMHAVGLAGGAFLEFDLD